MAIYLYVVILNWFNKTYKYTTKISKSGQHLDIQMINSQNFKLWVSSLGWIDKLWLSPSPYSQQFQSIIGFFQKKVLRHFPWPCLKTSKVWIISLQLRGSGSTCFSVLHSPLWFYERRYCDVGITSTSILLICQLHHNFQPLSRAQPNL